MIITGDRLVTVRRTKNLKSFIPYTSRPFFLFAESLCLAFNNLAFKAAFSKHLLNLFNKHSNHTGGDFFYFLQVMFETPFFTNSESAFDADSFNTKIDENDENFKISDPDGRPDFEPIPLHISMLDFPDNPKLNDTGQLRSPQNNVNDITNSLKPRLLPVGPAFPGFNSDIQNKPIHTNSEFSDSRSKLSNDQNDLEEDTIEEPDFTFPSVTDSNRFTEIVLTADTHYNPISDDQTPNPQWIVVTCDPKLIKLTPLFYTPDEGGVTVGALVARGQLSVINGQPTLNRNLPFVPLTEIEAQEQSCEFASFVSPDEVPEAPFIFNNFMSNEVSEIFTIFNTLTVNLTVNNFNNTNNFNNNSNYLFNSQNYSSNLNLQKWTNQTNNIICNIFHNTNGHNSQEMEDVTEDEHYPEHRLIESEALIEHHKVTPIHQTIHSDAFIQHHTVAPKMETIENEAVIQSNKIVLDERLVETDAIVEHHKVTPIHQTIQSDVTVQSNNINIHKETLNNEAKILSNAIDIKEDTIKSEALIQHHTVIPRTQTIENEAVIQSNKIVLDERLVETDAIVEHHKVTPIHQTIQSDVTVQSNNINIHKETLNNEAKILSNAIDIKEDTIKSEALIQHHTVIPRTQTIENEAVIQSNKIVLDERLFETDAIVEHHVVNPKLETVNTVANIQSNKITPCHEVIDTEAIVQHHCVEVIENTLKSTVEIPKFSVEFKEKEIPLSISVDSNNFNNTLINLVDRLLEVTKTQHPEVPSIVTHTATQTDSDSTVSDAVEISDSRNSSSNHSCSDISTSSSDDGNKNSDCTDGGDGDHSVPSSDLEDSNYPFQWIVSELKKIETKEQMVNLIQRIQLTDIDQTPFHKINDIDVPVILQMKWKERWLGVGQFYCPRCEKVFHTAAALHSHLKSSHEDRIIPHEQAAMEYINGLRLRWKVTSPHDTLDSPLYRTIHICPLSGCDYVVNRVNSLSCHISSCHQDLEALRREVGIFWSMHILHARRTNRLLLTKDVFHDTHGTLCKVCKDFIGKDALTVKQHANRSHPHCNIEGNITQFINVNIAARWLSIEFDENEINESTAELSKENDLRIEGKLQQNNDRNQPVVARDDSFVDLEARESRRRREERLRTNRRVGLVRASDRRPPSRLHVESTSAEEDSELDDHTSPHNTLNYSNDITACLDKASNWKQRFLTENYNFVNLPKLWGDRLKKHNKKIVELFETKVTDVIDWYENATSHAEHLNKEDMMLLCEGMISKITLLIRGELRKLFRPRNQSNVIHRPRSLDIPIQLRSATKFVSGIELIHDRLLNCSEADLDQPQRNAIADIMDKLHDFLIRAPAEFSQLVGGTDIDNIRSLIHDDNYNERIEFIRSKLEELELKQNTPESSGFKKFIQKSYAEDAKRTLEWFVLNDDTPECSVPIEDFENVYGASWSDAATLGDDPDELFNLDQMISSEDNNLLKDILFNDEAISKAIQSRSNLSAVGCDGVSNGVWKTGKTVTTRIIKLTLKCMLSTGLFPEIWKLNKTVMLFKKGDLMDAHSWRPITITPTLYRMMMCHISRSLQTLNSHHRFISVSQKGFMRIPAGAAEHATVVDEMIHDAARNQKSLYIMTIDFTDAFGSVPHKLIKKNLKAIGFDKNFIKSILLSYESSSTRIVSNKRLSKELFFRKGVKQGCPLSPTLFNICIESLLHRLNKCKEDGYHWFDTSTTVQAYADDIIIFSDTEAGMENLIKVIEEFCDYAGHMKINAKKCHSFTYISNNNSRCVLSSNFIISGGTVDNISIQSNCTYLGLPIACKASQRKHHVFRRIEEMHKDIARITGSALRFTQAVDAIKRFVLPRIDYELMANNAPTNALKKLDENIRGKLAKMLSASGIPTSWFYTARHDGGLHLQKLTERQKALTIRLYVAMVQSKDKSIREMIKASDDAEIIFRDATVDETSPFLNIKLRDNGSIVARRNHGTSNLLSRCVKSLHDLDIGLSFKNDAFSLTDLISHSSVDVNSSNVLKTIMKILMKRHGDSLRDFPMKGHTFHTLINSPLSNYFLKTNALMADSVVRFAIKARTNSLITGSLLSTLNQNDTTNRNNRCPRCGQVETLNHILNSCKHKKHLYTKRHDAVQNILRNYLTEQCRENVHANQCVRGRSGEHLTGDSASLKPDLWWWSNNRLFIAEFTIPYGMMSNRNGESQSTLSLRRSEKLEKYRNLINDCNEKFNCETTLLVFIISSLGAIPVETIEDLKKVTLSDKDVGKLGGRMVAAAIRESMILYYGLKLKGKRKKKNDSESTNTEHSDIDDLMDVNENEDDGQSNTSENEEEDNNVDDEDGPSMNIMDDREWEDLIHDVSSNEHESNSNVSSTVSTDDEADSEVDVLENSGTAPLWNQGSVANIADTNVNDDVEDVQHSASQNLM